MGTKHGPRLPGALSIAQRVIRALQANPQRDRKQLALQLGMSVNYVRQIAKRYHSSVQEYKARIGR